MQWLARRDSGARRPADGLRLRAELPDRGRRAHASHARSSASCASRTTARAVAFGHTSTRSGRPRSIASSCCRRHARTSRRCCSSTRPIRPICSTRSSSRLGRRVATGPNDVGQRLWALDPDLVPVAQDLLALAGSRPLAIADGHHRYETALRYRDTPDAPTEPTMSSPCSTAPIRMASLWPRGIASSSGVDDPASVLIGRGRRHLRRARPLHARRN